MTEFRRYTRTIQLFVLLVGVACAVPAQAAYEYTVIDYPGAISTQVWGIRNSGEIVGQAFFNSAGPQTSFVYDLKKKVFTRLPNAPGVLSTDAVGINESGAVVGVAEHGVSNSGFILEEGAFTLFSHPSWQNTEARAIGTSGLVTGFATDYAGHSVGFIYNPEDGSFIDILPSSLTIAQGINGAGQAVGNVTLTAGGAYPGSPPGSYGFLRGKSGAIQLFEVNGSHNTRARGITNSGRITGFFQDPVAGRQRGFVATLARVPGYQSLTVPDDDLLDVPGAVDTTPEGIDELGRVSGFWTDAASTSHGFLATPLLSE